MVTLSTAFLYASSHQVDVNSFAGSCPTPVLSNFRLGFMGSDIPCEFFPNPSPRNDTNTVLYKILGLIDLLHYGSLIWLDMLHKYLPDFQPCFLRILSANESGFEIDVFSQTTSFDNDISPQCG